MEELRSSLGLEREVLEDARKKADRILRTAAETVRTRQAAAAQSSDREIAELERKYEARHAAARAELFARLPVEQRRMRVKSAQSALERALRETLERLPRASVLSLLERELKARIPALGDSEVVVVPRGLTASEVKALLASAGFTRSFTLDSKPVPDTALPALDLAATKCTVRVSLESLAAELLSEKRAELAAALLGPEVLND